MLCEETKDDDHSERTHTSVPCIFVVALFFFLSFILLSSHFTHAHRFTQLCCLSKDQITYIIILVECMARSARTSSFSFFIFVLQDEKNKLVDDSLVYVCPKLHLYSSFMQSLEDEFQHRIFFFFFCFQTIIYKVFTWFQRISTYTDTDTYMQCILCTSWMHWIIATSHLANVINFLPDFYSNPIWNM